MKKAMIVLAAVITAAGAARAAEPGSSTAAFLKVGVGARAVGMGEAQAALAEGPEALYWNPAGLTAFDRRAVSFTHNEWLDDVRYEYIGVSYPFLNWGSFGFAAGRVSMGDLVGRDEQGNYTGDFGASDMALSLGYARELWPFLAVGGAAEYVSSKIENEAAATFAGSFGLTATTPLPGLSAGLAVANVGGKMTFIEQGDPLPLGGRAGLAYLLPFGGDVNKVTVAVDGVKYRDSRTRVNAGLEYWFRDTLAGRAGYKAYYDEDGLTGGLGVKYAATQNLALRADYAYADMGVFGATHRVTVGILF